MAGRTVTEADVRNVEQLIGARLPEDYREFLLRYGSDHAYFNQTVAISHPAHPDGFFGIDHFLGAVPRENSYCYDLLARYAEDRSILPDGVLTIADDGGGNFICLAVSGENRGRIYYWDHEEAEQGIVPTYQFLQPLADSFDEFLGKFSPHVWI